MDVYYLCHDSAVEGPFDLLSMIRKIKNGKLQRTSLVTLDPHEAPQHAEAYDELRQVIDEEEHALAMPQATVASAAITLSSAFRNGWENFQLNQSLAILTGVFAIIVVVGLIILSLLPDILLGIFGAVWTFFVFSIYMISVLRKSRMQLLNTVFYQRLLKKCGLSLLFASVLMAAVPGILPALLSPLIGSYAWLMVILPGSLAIAYLMFIPLIMSDRSLGVMKAVQINRQKMREGGLNFYTVIYGLLASNFILPIFPVMMPVSLSAACDLYDRVYNEY